MRDRLCQKFALGDCDEACSAHAVGCMGVSCATKFGNGKQNNFSPTRSALFGLIKYDLEPEPYVENSTRNLQKKRSKWIGSPTRISMCVTRDRS